MERARNRKHIPLRCQFDLILSNETHRSPRSSLLSSSKSGAQVPGKVGVTGCAFLPRCERGGAFCTNPLLKRLGTTTLLMPYTCMRSYATSREHRSDINGSRQGLSCEGTGV